MFLVPILDLKSLTRARGKRCRNFKSSALAASLWRFAPCTSFAPIVQRPMPLIWLPWAWRAVACVVPAARKSGWRGRRMRPRSRLRRLRWRKPAGGAAGRGAARGGGVGAPAPAMAEAGGAAGSQDAAAEWDALAREDDGQEQETPVVDSPSISGDWPASADGEGSPQAAESDWPSIARHGAQDAEVARQRLPWFRKLLRPPALLRAPGNPFVSLPTACAAMGALVLALMIWRVDVVRLLPQTAAFYKMVGLEVNLRGLMFKDVNITTETVEGKPVLVMEIGRAHV